MDHSAELIDLSTAFLDEVMNQTPGKELELWLNETHGAASGLYQRLSAVVTAGAGDGWTTQAESTDRGYVRNRILEPVERTHYFSITVIYLDSVAPMREAYHVHPYGEINLVVPLEPRAVLAGPLGWRGAGWTASAPGSGHHPASRGPVIAVAYLPAGRIAYDVEPPPAAVRELERVTDRDAPMPNGEESWPFGLDSIPSPRDHHSGAFFRSLPL
jgi:hypothetical protein